MAQQRKPGDQKASFFRSLQKQKKPLTWGCFCFSAEKEGLVSLIPNYLTES